jgi:TolB-like protein/class 3 adenylate cyclase
MSGERRLAAIMFTDIVGYSSLTQRDESLAMELLERHHKLLRPLFPTHNGNEIKTMGDAFLIEFVSALEAVSCAIEMQDSIREYNESAEEDHKFQIRIGIHLGDVIHRDGDVFGDGVNLASRIEPLAEPGGICVSEFFYDQIRTKLDAPLQSLGKKELKNIDEPVEVYRVILPWETYEPTNESVESRTPTLIKSAGLGIAVLLISIVAGYLLLSGLSGPSEFTQGTIPTAGNMQSLAVLPFANFSQEGEHEYFSDGITEELLNAFAQLKGLRVPARTSSFAFKGQNRSLKEIGKELNVEKILEGSVRIAGTKVRITAQLINVADESHIWSDQYDRELSDVFQIQEEIAQAIVEALRVNLGAGQTLVNRPTENLEAYNLYLQGRFQWNKRTKEGFELAINYFEQALDLDSEFALAYAGLADAHSLMESYEFVAQGEGYPKAKQYAERALELDNSLAEAYASLGLIYRDFDQDLAASEAAHLRAIELNPNYATNHHWYSILLGNQNNESAYLSEARIAWELDPLSPIINVNYASALRATGQFEEAKNRTEKALEIDPNFAVAMGRLASLYELVGEWDNAEKQYQHAIAQNSEDSNIYVSYANHLMLQGKFELAQTEIENASAINPAARSTREMQGNLHIYKREPEVAVLIFEELSEEFSDDPWAFLNLAQMYLFAHEFENALEACSESLKIADDGIPILSVIVSLLRTIIYSSMGEQTKATEEYELLLSYPGIEESPILIALASFYLDEFDAGFEALEKAYLEADDLVRELKVNPVYDPIRNDPRYDEMLQKIGLAD